jgi:sensor histidine kinase regulating citrate/malate metabolism
MQKKNYESAVQLKEYDLKEEYYHKIEEQQKEIRQIRHDMKNQLIGILGSVREGNILAVEKELEQSLKEIVSNETEYTENLSVDGVLKVKIREARKHNIDVKCKVVIPTEMKFEKRDIGIILGNAFDNAIEAAMQCEPNNRRIEVKLVYHGGALVFSMKIQLFEKLFLLKQVKKKS